MAGQRQLSRKRTAKLFRNIIREALTPPEKLTVSEWAERYREMGETSGISGKWSNEVTPYLKEIMDAFTDPHIQEINYCKPTQVGGTEVMINILGYAITRNKGPAMIVYPNDEIAKDLSKDRIKPSLLQTQEIKDAFYDKRSKQLALKFKGMTVYMTGAGNPTKVSSKPIRYLFIDEIDKLGGATKKEASPYNLAKERTKSYKYRKKIYTCSTPTISTNYVWKLHESAEVQKEYFVPCPHCGEFNILDFHQIKFDNSENLSNEEKAKTAKYICKDCGCIITDKEKIKAVRKGEWKNVKGTKKHPRTVSFHMNCLVSWLVTWEEIILEFLNSKDDPEQLQNFINSWLAEPWEDTKLKTSAELVLERQTNVPELVVPEWAKMLTAGVDIQETSLYWSIRAWGDFITSQNIGHGQVLSLGEIENIMNLSYQKETGEQLQVELCLIDSGDQTDDVYEFCLYNSDWAYPCKGSSAAMYSDFKRSKINKEDSKAYGMDLIIVDTGKYKDKIAARMRRENGKGSWMVYKGCDEEFARQVTAEHKINVRNGKKVEKKWVPKRSHIDNHYLDCSVYEYCAAEISGVKFLYLDNDKPEEQQEETKPESGYREEENWISGNDDWLD